MTEKRQTHIECLFDAINGGDDVDAAQEAQEIAEGLLLALKDARALLLSNQIISGSSTWLRINAAISKAQGRG